MVYQLVNGTTVIWYVPCSLIREAGVLHDDHDDLQLDLDEQFVSSTAKDSRVFGRLTGVITITRTR